VINDQSRCPCCGEGDVEDQALVVRLDLGEWPVIVAVALLVIGIGRSLAVTSSVVLVSAVVAALPFGCSVRLRGNCARCRSEFSSKRRA
jgi:hypothetical protein